jgi:hypothetical protein
MLISGGIAALAWLLAQKRGAMSNDEAAVYCDEFERMQDA